MFVFLDRFALEVRVCISGFAFSHLLLHVVRLYSERAFTAVIQNGQREFLKNAQATAMALAVLLTETQRTLFPLPFFASGARSPFCVFDHVCFHKALIPLQREGVERGTTSTCQGLGAALYQRETAQMLRASQAKSSSSFHSSRYHGSILFMSRRLCPSSFPPFPPNQPTNQLKNEKKPHRQHTHTRT